MLLHRSMNLQWTQDLVGGVGWGWLGWRSGSRGNANVLAGRNFPTCIVRTGLLLI